MRQIDEIKSKFPTLYEVLGELYVDSLKCEQGALAKRATINPFFSILYCTSEEQKSLLVEECFRYALERKIVSLDRLKRFKEEKKHVNIQNFINEITMLRPVFSYGNFLDESNNGVTPDFLAKILDCEVVFECISVNEAAESEKQRNLDVQDTNLKYKEWQKDNPSGEVFFAEKVHAPFGTSSLDKIVDKIRNKKSSRQVKNFQNKIMVMSFRNMMFFDSKECLPNRSNNVDGIYSGMLYHAFYGKKGDFIFKGNSFQGEKHEIYQLKSDGKFRRDSDYNLCILNFEIKDDEQNKDYVFFENVKNPMSKELVYKLCDIFNPYETHSILNSFVVK